ncbi:hypothetical protein P168DRAFT_290888 [Aspergillus campestris IBT 28561]|uniref:G-patch domain-containing protein n=1 Tax=Aspergillus campestris (strain IBT 28561) TaxID=1392248 RepID=A0A2I1D1K3_ASPC2|nr:uncharacterized protein P168DRAFT_290888 [Aspergillus campestris IBT 28561]PKY03752.1 hypothetical protein P168DRAFT_290888 [Aspergillus campestris IBT 28561]
MQTEEDDDEYFLPLEDQRVFGAGIRRKRVPFVRSSELNTTGRTSSAPPPSTAPGPNIANTYLSIVLGKDKDKAQGPSQSESIPPTTTQSAPSSSPRDTSPPPPPRCEVCHLPLETDPSSSSSSAPTSAEHAEEGRKEYHPHEASLAHQVCLTHSHPPSHLDRSRHGLRYLSAYGWDPDSRRGLGAPGREGIREPLKGRLKVDTVGLGASVPSVSSAAAAKKPAKVNKLNAKQVRKESTDSRRRGDRLREMFYQNDDVQRYLGGGG